MKNKMKRILAWSGIVLLLLLYLSTLVFALIGNELSRSLLIASVVCTIIIPIIIYAMMMAFKMLPGKETGDMENHFPELDENLKNMDPPTNQVHNQDQTEPDQPN